MKTITLSLGKLAWGMRVERADSTVFGFTSHARSKTVTVFGDPLVLEPKNAMSISSIARSIGLAVDNLEATVVNFDDELSRIDVLEGLWDGAEFYLFQFNWAAPGDGLIPWFRGRFGNASTKRGGVYVIELRDLRQQLHADVSRVTQANCDYRFGDPDTCTVNLAPHTYSSTVTSVASARTFTAVGLVNPADEFSEGYLTWTAGINAGLSRKVILHETGGVITLAHPMLRGIEVGDAFDIVRGCRKRRVDCIAFENVLNFPGMDSAPTTDRIFSRADPEAQIQEPVLDPP